MFDFTLCLASHPPLLSPSLLNNPVTAAEHYREFLIYHLPKLRLLDFKKVTGKVCRRRRWLAALLLRAVRRECLTPRVFLLSSGA